MRRLASIVAVLLLLAAAVPTMACVSVPPAENSCCIAMHNQCDPAPTTGCCQPQLHAAPQQLPAHAFFIAPPATVPHVVPEIALAVSTTALTVALQHPPPGRLSATSTILRI